MFILKERSIFDILGRVMGRNSYDVKERLKNLWWSLIFRRVIWVSLPLSHGWRQLCKLVISLLETHQMANCMGKPTVLTSGVSTFKLSALVRKEDNFFNSLMSSVELLTCITHDDSWDGHSRAGFDGMTIVGYDLTSIINLLSGSY